MGVTCFFFWEGVGVRDRFKNNIHNFCGARAHESQTIDLDIP